MKIAIVRSSSQAVSGTFYNLQEVGLARALLTYGVSVDIYLAAAGPVMVEERVCDSASDRVKVIFLPCIGLPGRQALFPGLFRRLREGGYDLIQVHDYPHLNALLVALAGRWLRVPVVLVQGIYRDYQRPLAALLQSLYDLLLLPILRKLVRACIAKTSAAAAYLRDKGMVGISLGPVGLDPTPFTASPEAAELDLAALPEGAMVLLYVGVVEPRRNVPFLVELLASLVTEWPSACLLIVGDGPELSRCRGLAGQLGVGDRVVFAGRVPQRRMAAIYRRADIFLLPSSYEIYGMVLLEAMYFGVPVVSSRTAGSLDLIEDRVTGILVGEFSLTAWRGRLLELLRAPRLQQTIREQGRRQLEEKFLWEQAAAAYYAVYRSILPSTTTTDVSQ